MQSLKFSNFSSLGARRTKHGLGRRSTWAMGVLAVLLAALALAVPMQQSASAQTPEPNGTVTITVDSDSIDYETATATITVTDGDTLFDRLDADHTENWYVSVKHTIKGANDYSESQQGGPGASDPDFVFGDLENGVVTATVKLDKWTDGNPGDQVLINSLVPGSTYVVEAVLAFDNPNYRAAGKATYEFNTEGDCVLNPDAKTIREWHSRSGLRIDDHKITRTSMVVAVNVPWDIAPMNSGRCLYYTMKGGGSTVKGSAFVYNQGSGARIGWIIATGLKPGTHYDFTIGIHADLSGFNSGIGARTDGPRLTVSVGDVEQTSATVTVTLPEGGVGEELVHLAYYKAEYQYEPDLDDKKVTPPAQTTANRSTSFDLETLTPATAYWVDVSTIAGFPTYETKSEPFTTKLGKPTELEVAPGDRQLEVSWQAPEGDGVGITGYEVEYRTNGEQTWSTSSASVEPDIDPDTDVTTYKSIISSLDVSTLYEVRVRAVNSVIEDDKDDYNWAEGSGTTLPDLPVSLEVAPGIEQLTLSWDEPTETGPVAITGYVVEYKKTSDTSWTSHTTVTAVSGTNTYETIISNLDFSTEYDVRVRANNGVTSDDYNWAEGSGTTLPDLPVSLEVAPGIEQLTLSWDEPTETGPVAITGYVVEYKKTSDTSWSSHTTVTAVSGTNTYETIITSLDHSTEYDVRVRADNDVTLQEQDDYNWEEGGGTTLPDVPASLEVAPGDKKLTVTWKEPAESGNVSITGYFVQYKKNTDTSWISLSQLPAGTLEAIINGLDNDVLYDVRVRAVNTVVLDDEDDYNWAEETETPVPDPSINTVTVDPNSVKQTEATVTVTIDRPNDEVQTVFVQYQTVPNGGWSTPAPPEDTDGASVDVRIDTLTGNTEYKVQAWLGIDTATKVKSLPFTTKPVDPKAPTIESVTPSHETLTVTWTAPTDKGGADIERYVIQWKADTVSDWTSPDVEEGTTTDGTKLTYDITSLNNGTTYDIRVRADNGVEADSYNWDEDEGTPSRKPDTPTIQSVTPGHTKLTVTWNKPANGGNQITNYILQWKDNDVAGWDSPLGTTTVGKDVFTADIGSLANGTTYAIQVRAKNDNGEGRWSVEDTGTPRPDPSIDSITVADITKTQTTAIAIVNIAHPTGELKMVHLRYGINTSPIAWETVPSQDTATGSVEFPKLTPLKSDTEYRVEASFDSTFDSGVKFEEFTTKRPTVSSVEIDESTIEQTGATAIVRIQEPNGKSQTVHLRYRPATQTDWSPTASDAGYIPYVTKLDAVSIPIADLKSKTLYEVQASLESDYSQSQTTKFTTEDPSLTDITISEVMQQSAKATIDIEAPNGRSLPVFVRYRKVTDPVNQLWAYANASSTGAIAELTLSNLDSGTKYEAQTSLDRSFPDGEFLTSEPFTTEGPSLTGLSWEAEMTSATITATIKAPNGDSQTIHYRYRPTSQTDWSTTATDAGSDSTPSDANSESAEFTLNGLNSSTQYEVEASFDSDLDISTRVVNTIFSTLSPDTSIKKVEVGDRTQTTANVTVTLNNPDTNGNTVYLRHRKVGDTAWSTPADPDDSDPDEAEFPLGQLDEYTNYEVEVSLDSGFANSTIVPFWTLREPEISSVNAVNPTKTTVEAVVDILYPDDTERIVHLRYQEKVEEGETQDWPSARREEVPSGTNKAEKTLTPLIAGTTYLLQASFDDEFPDNGTEETEFTTEYLPSVSGVIVDPDTITKTTATAIVSIANPDDIERTVYLQFRKKDKTPEDEWSDPPLDEDTDAAQVSIPMQSLIPGTEYEVEASFDNTFPEGGTEYTEFTTEYLPSVSSVRVVPNSITKTTATAEVSIANPDDTLQTVHLRYIEFSATPDWDNNGTRVTTTSDTVTATKGLENLLAGTTYILQASLDTNFVEGVGSTTFPTDPEPSAGSVSVNNEMETTATATVVIDDPDGDPQTVHLQYRRENAAPTDAWESEQPKTTTSGSETFDLDNLNEGTTYDVEAWLASDTSHKVRAEFTTLQSAPETPQNPPPPQQNNPPPQRSPVVPVTPPPPTSVTGVTFGNITQTSADATVAMSNEGKTKNTLRLRYREDGATEWDEVPARMTRGTSEIMRLTSLTAGTTHEVQAWFNSGLPPAGTQIYKFDTLDEQASAPDPGISNLKCENIGQISATAMVEIANAGTGMKEVFLKHSMDGTDEWTQLPFSTITYTDSTSISLTGLQEGTTYQVAVALSENFSGMVIESCTTLASDPSLSGVSVGSITQTTAVATVTIADAGSAQKAVLLQFREFGESEWISKDPQTTEGASTTFDLTGLEPRTTYEVKAYLSDDPDAPKYAVFTTLAPGPSVSGVGIGSITQISAVATVKIAYAGNAQKTVHLHYRKFGESEWIAKTPKTTEGASESFDLTGLTPNTKYEVEASLSSNFAGAKAVTFTTLAPEPSVSSIRVEDISQTAATAIAAIANSDGTSQTVHVRYRTTTPQGEWRNAPETTSTTGEASTGLTGLTADTEYEVQASLDGSFPDELTKNSTFTTLRFPSISNLEVEDETKNSATAVITIADPDGSSQTIHLRYRTTTPQGEWSGTQETTSSTATASIKMSGLTADTEYEAEVSLTDDFGVSETDTFRTLPPDPVVSKVSVNSIRQTTATAYIDIANANGNTQTVSLRYRTTTPRGAWSGIKTATSDTDNAEIDLTELTPLTPGTEYDVQASLENSFPSSRTRHDTFTTLRWPSISTFEVENVGRNGATVSATIADSRGVAQTVHVRHRATGYIAWRPTQQMDSVDDIASLRLRGLSSGTEYDAEASLDESFPSDETMSVTFTTVKREDDDDASSSGSGIVQAARAVNIPLLGFSPQMLRFVAIEGGDNPAPQTFSVWNRVQGTMNFTLSNHEEWLSQYPLSGVSTGPADAVAISASVDISGLPEGQYVDVINIQISPAGKTPGQVIVVLDVLPPDYIRQFVSRDESGVVVLPDGTVKLIVQSLSPPKDVDIELMKVNLQAHGHPPGEQERVVVAIESNTYEPGGDTPEDVAYAPHWSCGCNFRKKMPPPAMKVRQGCIP